MGDDVGLGFGLFIVREIVKVYCGWIDVWFD